MHSRATSLHCRVSPWTHPSRRSAGKPREAQQHISRCCTRCQVKQPIILKQRFRLAVMLWAYTTTQYIPQGGLQGVP